MTPRALMAESVAAVFAYSGCVAMKITIHNSAGALPANSVTETIANPSIVTSRATAIPASAATGNASTSSVAHLTTPPANPDINACLWGFAFPTNATIAVARSVATESVTPLLRSSVALGLPSTAHTG